MIDLKKYNQRLLAILGTLACLGLLILILIGLFDFISRRIRSNWTTKNDSGIVINQNQVIDTSVFSFSQEISILEPYQLDTAKPVFIIPIGQKDQTTKRIKVMTAGIGFSSSEVEEYYYSSFSGLYNNFVLIDYLRDIRKPIFSTKIALTEWAYMKIDETQLILFKGTNKDLNEDGRLNDDDFQSLFIFNVKTLDTKELSFDNQTVREFEPLKMTNKIYVRTGKDINLDKQFESRKEPTDLYFYDVATGESETLVPENIKKKIQEILNN
ncbi:MAG: hypothetical protein JXB34_15505 [Bacteroidales bacterium]|nr:hypothetical protein [Bacteroidales bacterium]